MDVGSMGGRIGDPRRLGWWLRARRVQRARRRGRRWAIDQPFDAPTHVDELASPMDEFGERLSEDGATLYLNYGASISGPSASLYTSTRTCLAR
jgi:hypothetical protein